MNKVRLHNVVMKTTALGPGTRMAIWFQGCQRNCKGCMSPMSRPISGGKECSIDKIINAVCSAKDIEGITISGGEPFLQIQPLYELIYAIRQRTQLGIIIYTGYTLRELLELNNRMVDQIVTRLADMIIDGEYIEELNDGKSLKGSSNQKVHFITDRYIPYKDLYDGDNRDVQVFVSDDEAFFVGIPDKETLNTWKRASSEL